MAPMKGDRVAIGTYFDGSIHIYNLPENKLTDVVAIPGRGLHLEPGGGETAACMAAPIPGQLVALDQATLKLRYADRLPPNRFLHEVSPPPDGQPALPGGR